MMADGGFLVPEPFGQYLTAKASEEVARQEYIDSLLAALERRIDKKLEAAAAMEAANDCDGNNDIRQRCQQVADRLRNQQPNLKASEPAPQPDVTTEATPAPEATEEPKEPRGGWF